MPIDWSKVAPERRQAMEMQQRDDLANLRALAWCVNRFRYASVRPVFEGGRRGSARTVAFVFHLEADDYREAIEAVRALVAQRAKG